MPEGHRSKIISFRVSDLEYATVAAASLENEFKSVALFARSAILRLGVSATAKGPAEVEINRLRRKVETLVAAVEDVIEQMSSIAGSVQTLGNRAQASSNDELYRKNPT